MVWYLYFYVYFYVYVYVYVCGYVYVREASPKNRGPCHQRRWRGS